MSIEQVDFTIAEEQVVSRIVLGFTNRKIGAYLGIAEKTVKSHLTSIYRKAGCKSDREFLVWYFTTQLPSQPT